MTRSILTRRTGAVLAAAALALGVVTAPALSSGAAAAPAVAVTTDPATAAAGWLTTRLIDGNHRDYAGFPGYDAGTSADIAFALAATHTGGDTVAAILSYLAANIDDYATPSYLMHGPSSGSAAKAATALLTGSRSATDVGPNHLNLITLAQQQCTTVDTSDNADPYCPGVGAGYNVYSSISESFIVLASERAGAPLPAAGPAMTWFLTLQCPNGGFVSDTSAACTDNTKADVDASAYAAMALAAVHSPGAAQSAALTRARAYLAGTQNANGSWTNQGIDNPDSTGVAAAALGGTAAAKARSWLVGQQLTTGPTVGPGATRGALRYGTAAFVESTSVKATADGVLGLATGASLATVTTAGSAAGTQLLALPAPSVPAQVRRGASYRASAAGFRAGETVRFTIGSAAASCALTAATNGTAAGTCRVPAAAATGRRVVTAVGATSGLASTTSTTVLVTSTGGTVPAPSTANGAASGGSTGTDTGTGTGAGLAATGVDGGALSNLMLGAVGLLLAGAGLLVLGRRRRRVIA